MIKTRKEILTLSVAIIFAIIFSVFATRFLLSDYFAGAGVRAALASLEECESADVSTASQFDRSERYRCYQNALRKNVYEYGLRTASEAFDIYAVSPGSPIRGGICHALGHDLGEAALDKGYTSVDILNYCSSICEGGCFNGVGHGFVVKNRSDLSGMDDFCFPNGYDGPIERVMACYHGFGHGITDIFGPDIGQGLELCENIKNNEGRYQCGHAIFMLFSSLPAERVRESAKLPSDFSVFCESIDWVYRESCYAFSGYLTYAGGGDVDRAARVCREAAGDIETECLKRIGEAIFSSAEPANIAFQAGKCAGVADIEARDLCVFGVATTSVSATNSDPRDTIEICSSSVLSENSQRRCFIEMAGAIKSIRGEEQMVEYCKSIPYFLKDECLLMRADKK